MWGASHFDLNTDTHTHKGGITWSYFAVLSASAIGQPRGLDVFFWRFSRKEKYLKYTAQVFGDFRGRPLKLPFSSSSTRPVEMMRGGESRSLPIAPQSSKRYVTAGAKPRNSWPTSALPLLSVIFGGALAQSLPSYGAATLFLVYLGKPVSSVLCCA